MKIITWNCNGALRKKLSQVDSLNGDLLVIQECENPEFSTKRYRDWAGDYLWVGTNKNKGLGIFPKRGNTVSPLNWHGEFSIAGFKRSHESQSWITSDLKLFLPCKLNNSHTILGVWTKGSDSEAFGYIGQFWKYLQIHDKDLSGPATLVLGDFNSNSKWDKADRWWSHSDVIRELQHLNMHSLYHYLYNVDQGSESEPTFFHQKSINKPYHIDYAFVSGDLIDSAELEIGKPSDWLVVSDHMPLILRLGG